jgi:hypothetical protein
MHVPTNSPIHLIGDAPPNLVGVEVAWILGDALLSLQVGCNATAVPCSPNRNPKRDAPLVCVESRVRCDGCVWDGLLAGTQQHQRSRDVLKALPSSGCPHRRHPPCGVGHPCRTLSCTPGGQQRSPIKSALTCHSGARHRAAGARGVALEAWWVLAEQRTGGCTEGEITIRQAPQLRLLEHVAQGDVLIH